MALQHLNQRVGPENLNEIQKYKKYIKYIKNLFKFCK